MYRLPLTIALLVCFALTSLRADPASTAKEFLKQSMNRYHALKSLQARCAWSDALGIPGQPAAGPEDTRTFVYAAPNKFKVVSSRAGFVQTSVSDGVHIAEYTNQTSLAARTYPAPETVATASTMQMQHPMFCGTLLYKFFGGSDGLGQLAQTSKASISFGPDVVINGEPCRTVRFYGTGQYGHARAAISKRDLLVRRITYDSAPLIAMMRQMSRTPSAKKIPAKYLPTSSVTTETYSNLVTDQDIAASAFDVTIPKGVTATAIADEGAPPAPPVAIGQPAPDFTVTALAGKQPIRLSSLRGQVVMVDFWATWCPPCRRGLPETQKLAAQYGGKGLAVLAVSDEAPDTITHFTKANHYTFPSYRDADKSADKAYKITAIPTLAIIDRAGNLAAFFVGLQEPATVLAALKKAGLETE